MSIIVETPGLFDTLQDRGRPGFRAMGVPLGGWFDADSAALANALAGNADDAACLEITQISGRFRALGPIRIAIAGPGAEVELRFRNGSGRTFSDSVAVTLREGDRFQVRHPRQGSRSYLAAAGGGWLGRPILGSVSSEERLCEGVELVPKSEVGVNSGADASPIRRVRWGSVEPREFAELVFVPSAEFDRSQSDLVESLPNQEWQVSSRSDRIGVRFVPKSGTSLGFDPQQEADRLSEPVVPGTLQWTGSELIALGVAGGTMGGYPVLGFLPDFVLAQLAQLRTGAIVRFSNVSADEAWTLIEARRRSFDRFLTCVRIASTIRT